MTEIRKIITTRETVFSELGVKASRPITRAVGMAVIRNPFAGQFVEDLRPLFEAGAMLSEHLMPDLVKLLDGPAVSYGKGAIVGVAGEMEHGGACVFHEVEALRELRVDEQTNFHDELFPLLAAHSLVWMYWA